LNLIRVTWNAAMVSHTDLAGIGSYTLLRQSLKTAEPSESTPWETLQTWDGPANKGAYDDTQVMPGMSYRYKVTVSFTLSKEIEEKVYPSQTLPDTATALTAEGTRDYLPTPVITVSSGVQLMGFVGVQDQGEQGEEGKNKQAKAAIKIWHKLPSGESKWIAGAINLDRLTVECIQKPERKLKDRLVMVAKKNQLMGNPSDKLHMDVATSWLLFNVQVHKAGDSVQGKLFIDDEELKRISDDGKTYKADTRSFWIIDANDPYFSDPSVNLPKTRRVLHENKELHNEINIVNKGAEKPEPTPPKPSTPSVTEDAPSIPESPSNSPSVTEDAPATPPSTNRTR
ncbi:MAG: hypothetical protein AB7F75_05005, partial [Planctomycetota bacterium]